MYAAEPALCSLSFASANSGQSSFSREGAATGDVAQRGAVGYHHAALQWRVQRHVVAYAELDGGWCKCLGVVCFVLRARCLFVGQGASYVAVVCVVTDRM